MASVGRRGVLARVQMSPCIMHGIKDGIDPNELDNADQLRRFVSMVTMEEDDIDRF